MKVCSFITWASDVTSLDLQCSVSPRPRLGRPQSIFVIITHCGATPMRLAYLNPDSPVSKMRICGVTLPCNPLRLVWNRHHGRWKINLKVLILMLRKEQRQKLRFLNSLIFVELTFLACRFSWFQDKQFKYIRTSKKNQSKWKPLNWETTVCNRACQSPQHRWKKVRRCGSMLSATEILLEAVSFWPHRELLPNP